ncbi:MAG: hypothetical protein ACRDLU_05920 [Gaiellaceae bacterium]
MINQPDNRSMNSGLVIFIVLIALFAFSPLLTRAGDLDDRDRRGWWSNH